VRDVIVALAFVVVLGGCAVSPKPVPATHAASPQAPTGRLAGAPPALRAGVVEYKDVPKTRSEAPVDHSQHHK
jgi:hypothetical protein